MLKKAETPLERHMDYLNDSRTNYNHCFVYSFHQSHDGVVYKVSFIMTTRNHAGAAMDDIRRIKENHKNKA